MEDKINIAEILRDMPGGTKLYSSMFGKCKLKEVINHIEYPISVYIRGEQAFRTFTKDGCYLANIEGSECILFPSSKMRCWDKFFKRGDIVYNPHSQMYAVFECWAMMITQSLTPQSTTTKTTPLAKRKCATQNVS